MLRFPTLLLLCLAACCAHADGRDIVLRNASYDPTREFYADYNAAFANHWRQRTGDNVEVEQSHGGSLRQAEAVADGLDADVVTLALSSDIDLLAAAGLLPADWQQRLPHNSAPYSSTVVFLVRKGNPRDIRDWGDLARPGLRVVTPDPKTSGGGRWNYLAAWAWASRAYRDGGQVLGYMRRLYANAADLPAGARGATDAFVGQAGGDVLVAWENEALRTLTDPATNRHFEIVYPSLSIRAETPVAVVDRHADAHGNRQVAEAYLRWLYSPTGQRLAAQHHYRPAVPDAVPPSQLARFRSLPLVTVDSAFGGWRKADAVHFADGGLFDSIREAAPQLRP
ncbi:sulfate ABC transporter substrate-binding protein [Luteimonas sp. BDR2-5]|uniref:sulfate ABC transporter substrate-binding protein n=1 Tax=Proluteimonas luteida TaxID=2878685 RepID=UPI001E5161F6|nr:sulfate ABC transporter substrate-binding protein [Luteimonas sp. BDR2-5]MCD9029255.1 sulfate ABC transporter substrate-binding protein [Luteimonas sp. BDR2-5]